MDNCSHCVDKHARESCSSHWWHLPHLSRTRLHEQTSGNCLRRVLYHVDGATARVEECKSFLFM